MALANVQLLSPEEMCALDATITDDDWPLIQQLWRAGTPNVAIYRLLRLRAMRHDSRRAASPAAARYLH